MGWREDAISEIEDLKGRHWVDKYGWAPTVVDAEDEDALDLFVTMRSQRHDGRTFVLRLRYQQDWQTAGRRETFVDPDDWSVAGPQQWPSDVRGVKNAHNPPSICLRGTWGFHSVLHTDRQMGNSTLVDLLLELQREFNR